MIDNALPKGWITISFQNCVDILDSQRKPINGKEREARIAGKKKSELFPYFGATNQVGFIDGFLFDQELLILGEDGVQFFDSMRRKAYLINGKSWVNNHAHVLSARKKITSNRFLCYYLNQFDYHGYVTGTTRLKLNQAKMKTIPITLPPLPEQKRIVDKLDYLLAKVDACKAHLDKIPEIIKRFRQSVLADATSGKLTEDWREVIGSDRIKSISYNSKFDLSTEYKELTEIPETWKWEALGNTADLARGRFSIRPRNDPRYYNGEYPFIQIGDLPRNGGYVNSHKQTLNEKGLKVSKVFKKGTIAIAIVGATIGNTGILEYDMCFPDSLVGISAYGTVSNLYIEYYLRSEKENIREVSYSSGGQPNIKLATLNSYPFPTPPISERIEIVKRIEALFSIADQLEEKLQKARDSAERLMVSILAKAFRGELVPQDPNDEPAEVLLKRIQAEKAQNPSAPKKAKRKTTNPRRTMEPTKPILEILKSHDQPMAAKTVWQTSEHNKDIEAFYAELKLIEDQVTEIREDQSSFLRLKP